MKNYCTVCHGRLDMWERMWGRFDHPTCRSGNTAKHPAPLAPTQTQSCQQKRPYREKGWESLSGILQFFPALREFGYQPCSNSRQVEIPGSTTPEGV